MKKIIDKASNKGIKEVEVFYRDMSNNEIKFENNNLKNVISSQNSGIGVRGVYNNKMGVCSFTHSDDAQSALDNLIESSEFSEEKEFDFSKPAEYSKPHIYDNSIENVSTEKLIDDGQKIINEIKQYDNNILTDITFETEVKTIGVSNSSGVNDSYKKSSFVAYVGGQIIDEKNFVLTDCYKYGITPEYDINDLINTFIERMKLARIQSSFESGNTKVLFTPRAFGDIMITIAQGVNGNAIEKGISPLCNTLGKQIFDERFTLIDDGIMDKDVDSQPFDDEGVPTKKNYIVDNGVLKSHIHSLKTAAKTNSAPTGNGNRGSYAAPPSPSFNNLVIQPGSKSFEEMLEVMENGIIIDEIMGLGMNNLLNGDFGGNIQLGYKVKKGEIVGRVKNAVFNSNIYKILKDNLIEISNLEYTHPVVNSVFSSNKQPCALFKDINITIK